MRCTQQFENAAYAGGAQCVAGVDEVGRGSLFGPVVAAAVVLDRADRIRGLNDSKLLLPAERERLSAQIQARALAWSVAALDAACIDAINIYQASRRCMVAALAALPETPDFVLVDALRLDWVGPQRGLIHGDARSISIAAASIVAKVFRDDLLRRWDRVFPVYRLASNKGYSTPDHLAALVRCGPSPLHRRSFAPMSARPGTELSD